MKKRKSISKQIGFISLTVILALGMIVMANSLWSDTLEIDTTIETGAWKIELTECISCDPSDNITCQVNPSDTLNIEITQPFAGGDYYCYNFAVTDTGTVPVRIHEIIYSSLPTELTVELTGIAVSTIIDPSETKLCNVYAHLSDNIVPLTNYHFTITFTIVTWDEP